MRGVSGGLTGPNRDVLQALKLAASAAVKANKWLAVTVAAVAAISSVLTVGVSLIAKGIVDSALSGHGVLGAATVLFGAYVVATLALGWLNANLATTLAEETDHWLETELARLAVRPPGIAHLADVEYQNQLHLLLNQRGMLGSAVTTAVSAAALAIRLLVAELLIWQISPFLLIFPFFVVPTVAVSGRVQRLLSESLNQVAERTRMASMLFQTASDAQAGRELRVYDLGAELVDRHTVLLLEVDRVQWRARWRSTLLEGATWVFFAGGLVGAIFISLRVDSRAAPGNLMLLFVLAGQIAGQTQTASFVIGSVGKQADAFRRYRFVRDHAERGSRELGSADAPALLASGIDLDDVEFAYPGSDKPAISGVSCHIPAGSSVALVGPTGAGKSSLVKLLLGLYEPTKGTITVDGVPLPSIDPAQWLAASTAAFQDFCRFELAALQSVGVGDLPRSADEATVLGALDRARAQRLVEQLPRGLQTQLGRTLDGGVDLSEGQWQKVAIGRAMMRAAPLMMFLDEPTASLDAETEYELFESYRAVERSAAAAVGAITVLVSHRLATVRGADLILVIADGRIAESGRHDDLIRAGGHYARMFELQAKDYR